MHAVFIGVGYANDKFARSIRLPSTAELSLSHPG